MQDRSWTNVYQRREKEREREREIRGLIRLTGSGLVLDAQREAIPLAIRPEDNAGKSFIRDTTTHGRLARVRAFLPVAFNPGVYMRVADFSTSNERKSARVAITQGTARRL